MVGGSGDPHVRVHGFVFPLVEVAHCIHGMFLDNVVGFGVVHYVHVLIVVCYGCGDHGVDHYDGVQCDGDQYGDLHCGVDDHNIDGVHCDVGDYDVDGIHYDVGDQDVGVHHGLEILGCTNDAVPDDEVQGDHGVLFECDHGVHGSAVVHDDVVQAAYMVHAGNVVDGVVQTDYVVHGDNVVGDDV